MKLLLIFLMAAKTFYLMDALDAQGWQSLNDGTTQAAATSSGWIVSTGNTNHSKHQSGTGSGTERAATTFDSTTYPTGTLDTTLKDAFRSQNAISGDFASANWVFHFVVRAVTLGGSQNGRIRFRIIKADPDGSNATEITSGQQQGSLAGVITTAADFDSTLTVNPGAFTITNQYLFIQIAWERTVAGGMTTSDVHFRTGSSSSAGTRIVTSDFTVSITPTRGRLSDLEFEVPFLLTRGRISNLELETPFVLTRGRISDIEFEVPIGATRGRLSNLELEIPSAPGDPTRGLVSALEFEIPLTVARGLISGIEFEVPTSPTKGRISIVEFEIPTVITRGRIGNLEFEIPSLATRGRLSAIEFQVPDLGSPSNDEYYTYLTGGGELDDL